jgi:hypothetical protein
MGLLDIDRQATQARLTRDVGRSKYGMLNDDNPIQKSTYGGMYGSLMQDPADKERMDREMWQNTVAMMPIAGMNVYHGSPHIFNKFRMDKIGTGEGAQAYGQGLYLAENPNVAKEYQKKFANTQSFDRGALREYFKPGNIVGGYGGKDRVVKFNEWDGKPPHTFGGWSVDVKSVEKKGEDWIDSGLLRNHGTPPEPKDYEKVTGKKAAHLYKVDLPDDQIKNMLDFDAPFSKQPKKIKELFKKTSEPPKETDAYYNNIDYAIGKDGNRIDPNDLLFKKWVASPSGSTALKKSGFPGIKYFDQGSRSGGPGIEAVDNELAMLKKQLNDIEFIEKTEPSKNIDESLMKYTRKKQVTSRIEELEKNREKSGNTRNFVVFDENIPKILERNEQPIGGLLDK